LGIILLTVSEFTQGQSTLTRDSSLLKVGVFPSPPYVIQDIDGTLYGVSIDLWYHLADELNLNFEFEEYSDQLGLLRALDYAEVDLAINPMTINGARLKLFEAAHPFITTQIGVASSQSDLTRFRLFFSNLFSVNFLRFLGILLAMILVFGLIIWIAEKRRNPNQFKGLIDGFWWSVVTMTTVGYGDKAPQTVVGRVISVLWMFIAIILISSFTATIAATMTVNSLEAKLDRFQDIQDLGRIGTVDFSASKNHLLKSNLPVHVTYQDPLEGLQDLARNNIDIFVYDQSVLQYLIREHNLDGKVKMVPVTAGIEYRSFLFPQGSQLIDLVNPVLADRIMVDGWKKTLQKYHLVLDEL